MVTRNNGNLPVFIFLCLLGLHNKRCCWWGMSRIHADVALDDEQKGYWCGLKARSCPFFLQPTALCPGLCGNAHSSIRPQIQSASFASSTGCCCQCSLGYEFGVTSGVFFPGFLSHWEFSKHKKIPRFPNLHKGKRANFGKIIK